MRGFLSVNRPGAIPDTVSDTPLKSYIGKTTEIIKMSCFNINMVNTNEKGCIQGIVTLSPGFVTP